MRIDRNNYEEFAMDYLDGSLTGNDLRSFEEFLRENPDIASEIADLSELDVGEANTNSSPRIESDLKIPEGRDWDKAIIELVEGDLSAGEERKLLEEIKRSPALSAELELYQKTRLEPDYSMVFPNKEQLYREGKVVSIYPRLVRWAAAAAVLALAIWWFNIPPEARYNPGDSGSIAEQNLPEVPTLEERGNKGIQSNDPEKSYLNPGSGEDANERLLAENSSIDENQGGETSNKNPDKEEPGTQTTRREEFEFSRIASMHPKSLNISEPSLEVAMVQTDLEMAYLANYPSTGNSTGKDFQSIPEWLAQRGKEIVERTQGNDEQAFSVKKEIRRQRQTISVKLGFIEVEHSSLQ